ncbi:hypothetical protein MP228_011443 [Amoeboaphelidium protococcarum]|nr:hypothetical protein MP228_011443 [Amoeboaphelidium protococcarum]
MDYIGAQLLAEYTIDLLVWWPVLLAFGQAGLMAMGGLILFATGSYRGMLLFNVACYLILSLLIAPVIVLITAFLWTSKSLIFALFLIVPIFVVGNAIFVYLSFKPVNQWSENDFTWYLLSIVSWTYLDNFVLKQFIANNTLFLIVTIALYAMRWLTVHTHVALYCLPDPKLAVKTESFEKDHVNTSMV